MADIFAIQHCGCRKSRITKIWCGARFPTSTLNLEPLHPELKRTFIWGVPGGYSDIKLL